MIKKGIKLILLLLCMISIFTFSSDSGEASSKKSDGLIVRISEMIVGHKLTSEEREKKIEQYVVLIRKTAHFVIYFILGYLIISNLIEYYNINKKLLLIAILLSFLYACSDEIHQLLVPGRSGKILDILLDTIGSSFGIGIYYLFYKKLKSK